jgi:transaldolase
MVMKSYLDAADLESIAGFIRRCDGVTTNPSILKRAGVTDYRAFGSSVLACAGGKPVSFEVLASDLDGMADDARAIAGWGGNVFVKVPVLTPTGSFTGPILSNLSLSGIKLNVTAVMTIDQVHMALASLQSEGNIISIFAGRIADSGVDPELVVREAVRLADGRQMILWASVREPFNFIQADRCGADIITLTPELIKKMGGFGRDLTQCSLETVRQFTKDAEGITL